MLCSVVILDGSASEMASKSSRQCGPCHSNVGVRPAFLTVAVGGHVSSVVNFDCFFSNYRGHMSTDYKTEEKTIKNIVYKNVQPTNKNIRITLTIYYKIRKTTQLLPNRPSGWEAATGSSGP
ncbi:hypothetical protein E2C01_039561 [Portunus trituberculatus]|uniref:Uncharacterized protein n=1 Tax=Portunus trituberculatus TaxID=210409 RepID=A0A5B7FK60_PORTR|nr:hypothetical protein [Portunus trituberculatus]